MKNKIWIIIGLCIALTGCGAGSSTPKHSYKDGDIASLALEDQVVQLDGKIYALYDPVSILIDNGWKIEQEMKIDKNTQTGIQEFTHTDGSSIILRMVNFSDKEINYDEALISSMSFNAEKCKQKVEFPKGITLMESTIDDVQKAYGGPIAYKEANLTYRSGLDMKDDDYSFTISESGKVKKAALSCLGTRAEKPEDISFDAKKVSGKDPYLVKGGSIEGDYDEISAIKSVQVAGVDIQKSTTMKDMADAGIEFTWKDEDSANAKKGNIHFLVNFKSDDDKKDVKTIVESAKASGQPSSELTIFSISFDSEALSVKGENLYTLMRGVNETLTAQETIDAVGRNYFSFDHETLTVQLKAKPWALQMNFKNDILERVTLFPHA